LESRGQWVVLRGERKRRGGEARRGERGGEESEW
jgi:hypothetical protein